MTKELGELMLWWLLLLLLFLTFWLGLVGCNLWSGELLPDPFILFFSFDAAGTTDRGILWRRSGTLYAFLVAVDCAEEADQRLRVSDSGTCDSPRRCALPNGESHVNGCKNFKEGYYWSRM